MPLEKMEMPATRVRNGFSFPMRVSGTTEIVTILVADNALVGRYSVNEEALLSQLDREREDFEALASQKFMKRGENDFSDVKITLADVLILV
jgi:hypothetical protein